MTVAKQEVLEATRTRFSEHISDWIAFISEILFPSTEKSSRVPMIYCIR